jgi:hypothetical protein
MRVTDATPQPKASRWLIAAAIFGGVCHLSCVVLSLYEDYCRHHPFVWGSLVTLVLPVTIVLAPLLVLFALRRVLLVVLIYVSVILWILVQYVHDLRYGCLSVPMSFQKFTVPGVFLGFFGTISIAVFLVWAAIRLVVLMWRVLKFDRAEP